MPTDKKLKTINIFKSLEQYEENSTSLTEDELNLVPLTASDIGALPLTGGTCTGTVYAPAFQISSDIRLKSNLEKIDSALDKVSKLVAYTYNKQGVDGRQAGVIAQDVEKVLPEAVRGNDEGYKTVDYSALTALLINAINELRGEINGIKLP